MYTSLVDVHIINNAACYVYICQYSACRLIHKALVFVPMHLHVQCTIQCLPAYTQGPGVGPHAFTCTCTVESLCKRTPLGAINIIIPIKDYVKIMLMLPQVCTVVRDACMQGHPHPMERKH